MQPVNYESTYEPITQICAKQATERGKQTAGVMIGEPTDWTLGIPRSDAAGIERGAQTSVRCKATDRPAPQKPANRAERAKEGTVAAVAGCHASNGETAERWNRKRYER